MNVITAADAADKGESMSTFTIDTENNITVYAGTEEAAQAGGSTTTSFDSLAALSKVSADWQMSRFVEIWNSIPGQNCGEEVHGPQVSRDANLEGHSAAGGKRAAKRTRNEGQEAGQGPETHQGD